jgi:nucleoside-diphosphate-sugar epimerase
MSPLNISGPEVVSVRAIANIFADHFGKPAVFDGEEGSVAWLVNTNEQQQLLGYPNVPLAKLIDWTADWVANDRASLGKPTHFEINDGNY